MFVFRSTYLDQGTPFRWLKGNHHGHSTASDGKLSPEENIRLYEEAGYDYLALSEHDRLLDISRYQSDTGLCLVPAIEVTSAYGQTLMYLGATREFPAKAWTPRRIMEEIHAAGGLFIYDHPSWIPVESYTTDALLDTMEGMKGMEIYTAVIERLPGKADATDRWDRLLSRGWRVYGHATDDQHERMDCFLAWNQVQWPADKHVSWPGIVDACADGRFYASTGVTIHRVGIDNRGQQIHIESDADEIWWLIRRGAMVHKSSGGVFSFTMDEFRRWTGVPANPTDAVYVRAELYGRGSAMAWTQPFWIEQE